MSRVKKRKKNHLTAWVGVLLIIAALAIWLYSIIELKSNEIMLTTQLSIEEVWRYEGAIKWWKNAYVIVVLPIIGILTISGIGLMLSARIVDFIQKGALRKLGPIYVAGEVISREDKIKDKTTADVRQKIES